MTNLGKVYLVGAGCGAGDLLTLKAQRILAGIDSRIGPIFTHGAVEKMVREYRASGVALPVTTPVFEAPKKFD